ncbi:MAG: hypothetical protein L7U87_09310 [Chlamydiales bacterium]|nr:hypothetical protein [Chlamydiales bacterium]
MKNLLTGSHAFYKQVDYEKNTKEELDRVSPPSPITYEHEIETKTWRIAKRIFSLIAFPISIYNLIHVLIGKVALLPA